MTSTVTPVRRLGLASAALGIVAGVLEIVVGTNAWFGAKNEPTSLGVLTIGLGMVIGIGALASGRARTTGQVLGVAAALVAPALLGLTTAGAAWAPAAVTGLVAGAIALRGAHAAGSVVDAVRSRWPAILLVVLALIYLTFGIFARSGTGLLGVAGALAVVAALALHGRSRPLAMAVLVTGTLPFAVVAYWSVVIPLTATLLLVIGLPYLLASDHRVGVSSSGGV